MHLHRHRVSPEAVVRWSTNSAKVLHAQVKDKWHEISHHGKGKRDGAASENRPAVGEE